MELKVLEEQVLLCDVTPEFMQVVSEELKTLSEYMKRRETEDDVWGIMDNLLEKSASDLNELIEISKLAPPTLVTLFEKPKTKQNAKMMIFKLLKPHEKDPTVSKLLKENQAKFQDKNVKQSIIINPFARLMGESLPTETIKQLEKAFNLRRAETILCYWTCLGGTFFLTTLNLCFEPIVGSDYVVISFAKLKSVSKIRIIVPGIKLEYEQEINTDSPKAEIKDISYFGFINTDAVYNAIKKQATKLGYGAIMK